jgi:hypothetical protein
MRPSGDCSSLPGFIVYLVLWPVLLGIPRIKRTAPACLLLGRKKSLANASRIERFFGRVFLFFHEAPPTPVWLVGDGLPGRASPLLLLSLLGWLLSRRAVLISSVHPSVFWLICGRIRSYEMPS